MKKIIAMLLVASSSLSFADTCAYSDVEGTWVFYSLLRVYNAGLGGSLINVPLRCTLVTNEHIPIDNAPSIVEIDKKSSYCETPINGIDSNSPSNLLRLKSSIAINTSCKITGNLTITNDYYGYLRTPIIRQLDGYVGKDKASMSGVMWPYEHSPYAHSIDNGSMFNAIKQ